MSETTAVDVCVLGAGPVGGTLACRLAAAGLRIAVVDQAALPPMEHPAFDGRAYAIAAGSRRLLDESGLWDMLPDTPHPILDIRVTDGRVGRPASPLFLHFDHRDLGGAAGPFGWMVEARALRRALNARLHSHDPALNARLHSHDPALNARLHSHDPALNARLHDHDQAPDGHRHGDGGVRLFAPARAVVDRQATGAAIRLDDGTAISARLVVAAEGRRSPSREQAGIPVTHLPYGQTGIVCAISHEHPHHGVALEHFLPAGPFAALPMAPSPDALDGGAAHVSAIVWTERTRIAQRILALDEARFTREITRRLGSHLGTVRAVGRRWSYPLSAMLVHRYTDTRLVLVGDAAHGIHPIAGQGLNLGFQDAIVLSDLLIEARARGEDPGSPSLLARYQRLRRPDNLAMLLMTDGLDRLFSSDHPALRIARDVGIASVHRMGPLKRFFMRRAMGVG